ncbi:S41 family peptidase [Patescibacteria group bacterium]|nr:S41 family peptidase [Patescibacteria group bacterium]
MELQEWEQDATNATPGKVLRSSRSSFFKIIRLAIAFAVVLAVGFSGGFLVGSHKGTNAFSTIPLLGDNLDATPDPAINLTDFWKVYNALNAQYVVTHASSTLPTSEEKLWGAIQGLTNAYGDPYTVFFPPSEAKAFADNIAGSFSGVGMEIGENKDNILTVIAPLKGTPADKAGILSGDEIIGINGKSTQGLVPDEAIKLIRGPKGTVVTFTILRGDKQMEIKVTRDTIQVPEIEYGLNKTNGVYTIALYEFTQNSAELFNTAFTAFKASGSKDLIVDLRGDPGGYLDAAVNIASHFLSKGSVIVTEDYKGKQQNIVHTSTGTNDLPVGTHVVVLIDQGSASASEILSGALQDHHAATLIGARSFGKGSVQQLIDVDGASLKVTVAAWLTPNGHSITGIGITPDILATTTAENIAAKKDVQLDRAVQFFLTGK